MGCFFLNLLPDCRVKIRRESWLWREWRINWMRRGLFSFSNEHLELGRGPVVWKEKGRRHWGMLRIGLMMRAIGQWGLMTKIYMRWLAKWKNTCKKISCLNNLNWKNRHLDFFGADYFNRSTPTSLIPTLFWFLRPNHFSLQMTSDNLSSTRSLFSMFFSHCCGLSSGSNRISCRFDDPYFGISTTLIRTVSHFSKTINLAKANGQFTRVVISEFYKPPVLQSFIKMSNSQPESIFHNLCRLVFTRTSSSKPTVSCPSLCIPCLQSNFHSMRSASTSSCTKLPVTCLLPNGSSSNSTQFLLFSTFSSHCCWLFSSGSLLLEVIPSGWWPTSAFHQQSRCMPDAILF